MQICTACSTTAPDASGRFCPECGGQLVAKPSQVDGWGALGAGPQAAVASTQSLDAAADDKGSLVGTTIDGFAIESVIGGGAFGTVYRAKQTGLDRAVAIKVPTYEIAADPVMSKRFAREAKAAAAIHHPGVVSIYQVGAIGDGRPYLAMELVAGQPLDLILANGPIAPIRALGIVRQIASALSETHAAGVVHRDLKPSNIMWRRDRNDDDLITIVDFGIALAKPGTAEATRLTANNLIGTPHYMSPEQAHGEVVDARADLYALGCLLYELLTGETPFAGSGFEVLLAHLGRPVPRPSDKIAELPEALDRLVLALMAKKPGERIQSADALVELIDETLDTLEDQLPAPPKAPRSKRKTASTRKDKPSVIPIPRSALEGLPIDTGLPPRPAAAHHARYMAYGAALAFALSISGLLVARLIAGPEVSASAIEDRDTPITRREIFRDDGSTRLRVWVPDPLQVGERRLWIELRNKLGALIVTNEIVVIVDDPAGGTTGGVARPRSSNPDQFAFVFDFKTPGSYQIRIFPPETATRSSFAIPVDVTSR